MINRKVLLHIWPHKWLKTTAYLSLKRNAFHHMSLRPSSANIGYKYLIYIYGHDQYVLWLMRTVRVCVLLWNLHQVNYLQSQAVISCHSLAAADPAERLCFERGHCPCWGCRSSRYPGRSSPAIWKQKCNLSTHWIRVTHISNIIGSDNSLSPGRRQAIIWTNAGMLLIGPLGTNFNDILIEIHTYSSRKPILKCGMEKLVICLGLNVLSQHHDIMAGKSLCNTTLFVIPFTNGSAKYLVWLLTTCSSLQQLCIDIWCS